MVRAYENEQLIAEAAARELKVAINQVVETVYKKRKMELLEEKGWRCERCGSTQGLQCHHKVFRSHGRSDLKSGLEILCFKCHEMIHSGKAPR